MIFDTHCHLNDKELLPRVEEIISNAKLVGVNKFLIIGFDYNSSLIAIELAKKYDCCYAAIGYHPTEVTNVSDEEFNNLMSLAKPENKVIAIGEIGLDYYWVKDEEGRNKQKEFFVRQINVANELGLPISIHNREATEDCMNILKEHNPLYGSIMHCFAGSVEIMKEYLKLKDSYVALGGTVTFKNAKTPKEVATAVPLDRLLIETDCPYLTPHPFRGQQNEPKYLTYIIDEIASLKGMWSKEIEDATYINACKVLKLK